MEASYARGAPIEGFQPSSFEVQGRS